MSSAAAAAAAVSLRTAYSASSKQSSFYRGGPISIFHTPGPNRPLLICPNHYSLSLVDLESGRHLSSVDPGDEQLITAFAVHQESSSLAIATQSQLVYIFKFNLSVNVFEGVVSESGEKAPYEEVRRFKSHNRPISSLQYDSTGQLLALGHSDGLIRVYDTKQGFFTHNFKAHEGSINDLKFHPDPDRFLLVSASSDSKVILWDLVSKQFKLYIGHLSAVTALEFGGEGGQSLISVGRDQVIIIWSIQSHTQIDIIPVLEEVETMTLLPLLSLHIPQTKKARTSQHHTFSSSNFILLGGSKGRLCIWDFKARKEVWSEVAPKVMSEGNNIRFVQLQSVEFAESHKAIKLVSANLEMDLSIYNLSLSEMGSGNLPTIQKERLLVGFSDELADLKWAHNQTSLVSASNSEKIRLFKHILLDSNSSKPQWAESETLIGHEAVVLSLDVSADGNFLLSSSRDSTVRLWFLDSVSGSRCIAAFVGHTDSVGAVAFPKKTDLLQFFLNHKKKKKSSAFDSSESSAFIISGSQDKTIKLWPLTTLADDDQTYQIITNSSSISQTAPVHKITASLLTSKAHEKDINSISVAPNNSLIATGSQDKLVKVWDRKSLKLMATLGGHRRGVWNVEFSPVDRCLLSASADKTIKIWSLADYSCLKTFEGHLSSVLRASFITLGMQILSAGADGQVKLWNIKTTECVNTFEAHEDKIWALAVRNDGSEFVSGGADSAIVVWNDVTKEIVEKETRKKEEKILKQQELSNCLSIKNFRRAIVITLQLDQPHRLRTIFQELLDSAEGHVIPEVLRSLEEAEIEKLLKYIRDWNTNAKYSLVAQFSLNSILSSFALQKLREIKNFPELIDPLIAYSERHLSRIDGGIQRSFIVDFSLASMKKLDQDEEENLHEKIARNEGASENHTPENVLEKSGGGVERLQSEKTQHESSNFGPQAFQCELERFMNQPKGIPKKKKNKLSLGQKEIPRKKVIGKRKRPSMN